MGADMAGPSPDGQADGVWLSVEEAARRLGIEGKSLKRRLVRDALAGRETGRKNERGEWVEAWVTLVELSEAETRQVAGDTEAEAGDTITFAVHQEIVAGRDAVIASQRQTIAILETRVRWLEEEAQRRDTLHMQALELFGRALPAPETPKRGWWPWQKR